MKRFTFATFCISILATLLMVACDRDKKKGGETTEVEDTPLEAPAFDADSAFYFVKAQTDFGPRVPNTEAHRKCADFLKNKLAEFCDTVIAQEFIATAFDGTQLQSCNLIGSFDPENPNRIVFAAHWDSRPFADHDPDEANHQQPIDGANDGASGVGVLLEIARQLSLKSPEVGVDIVFFDAEDYGTPEGVEAPPGEWWGLGSQYWSRHPHRDGYRARYGALLDMVGAPDAHFRYEYFSNRDARIVLNHVWNIADMLGFGDTFIAQPSGHATTDDHYYVNTIARIPMIDIIHQDDYTGTSFPATWHTMNDNIDHIDKNTLAIVGKTLLCVIYNEK